MEKVKITKEDYEECLKFILKLRYLWGGATIDFASSGVKRDIGKYVHDHIGGKLAEIAVKKFLKQKYNLNVGLGFEKYDSPEDFMLGDIEKVIFPDGKKVSPKIKVEIKGTKPSSRWWLISDNEFNSREYDVYILVVIDLPLDHIIRFFKDSLHLEDKDLYPDNPNKKHKRKNWYCIHGYKTGFILIRYLLISYYKNIECIYLFHISPSNNMSEEVRRYKEIKKIVKF